MSSFDNSWKCVKSSWHVLSKDKELLLFPVISGIASLLILGSFVFATYYTGLFERAFQLEEQSAQQGITAIYFVMYLILSFVTVYFNSALMFAADERLSGGDPNVGSGIRGANQRLGRIFMWSLFAGTVNLLIHALESAARSRNNFIGQIMTWLVGTAWALATYFAIPVVVFEGLGVFASLKRSGQLFRQRWGASLVGDYGIGFVFGILSMVAIVPAVIAFYLLGVTAVSIGVAIVCAFGLLVITVYGMALGAVYKVALYRFASSGQVPSLMPSEMVEHAYHSTGRGV